MSRRNQTARERRHQKTQNVSLNRSAPAELTRGSSAKAKAAASDSMSDDLIVTAAEKVREIEAAVKLLSDEMNAAPSERMVESDSPVQEPSDRLQSQSCVTESVSTANATNAESQPGGKKPDQFQSADDTANYVQVMLHAFRDGLTALQSSLREEFRTAVNELQSAQAAATTSQSEVLRTLTEVMFQTAAVNRDVPAAGIEAALNGIEDRIVQRLSHLKPNLTDPPGSTTAGEPASLAKSTLHVPTVKLKDASGVVSRSWEQIRSELMARGDFNHDHTTEVSHKPEQLPELTPLSSDRHFRLPEQDPTLEVPPAIDVDGLSLEALRDAFREREAFLTTVIARIRRQQESPESLLTKEQLCEMAAKLPEELEIQVRQTLRQMEDLARMGELELSIERARIARQVNQLEHTQQILERNARQLGMTLNPDGSIAAHKNPTGRNSSSRRWLGKLGFGQ